MRILVIEDHPDLAANIGDYLSALGHSVDFAADGDRGLRLATEQSFDVILLDRMLPGRDGTDVCRQLRQQARSPVPILMLTALDATDDKIEGLRAGADDYLAKPFAMSELEARIEALHRRAHGHFGPALLRVADLEYDPERLEARRDGQPLTLNPSLRKLLEYLMRETRRVVPRTELEQLLWGDSPPPGDVLRAHIHMLRNAVDKPFDRPLLHTVHGHGYRLTAGDDD